MSDNNFILPIDPVGDIRRAAERGSGQTVSIISNGKSVAQGETFSSNGKRFANVTDNENRVVVYFKSRKKIYCLIIERTSIEQPFTFKYVTPCKGTSGTMDSELSVGDTISISEDIIMIY